eukprot:gnl/MRDRNA2_/MRDRNA2_28191_c0_seq1.p1 gnl/MRDRNA2_/MRDRNA2_28191_c0~~gnl/MRDRNA2_/MRDRNA2_28191_c0_seq1.p1  ORF type:complete len:340 (-),score=65.04 gnl/MRDRNA2_/MRDRNA2_28191_c0_seq1:240-1154(-)
MAENLHHQRMSLDPVLVCLHNALYFWLWQRRSVCKWLAISNQQPSTRSAYLWPFYHTDLDSTILAKDPRQSILPRASPVTKKDGTCCAELLSHISCATPSRALSIDKMGYIDSMPPDPDSDESSTESNKDSKDAEQTETERSQETAKVLDYEALLQCGYKTTTSLEDTEFYKKLGEDAAREQEKDDLAAKQRKAEELAALDSEQKKKWETQKTKPAILEEKLKDRRKENFGQKLRRNRRMGNHGSEYDFRANELNAMRFKYGDDYWGPDGKSGHMQWKMGERNWQKVRPDWESKDPKLKKIRKT